jgi:hypothetical protein
MVRLGTKGSVCKDESVLGEEEEEGHIEVMRTYDRNRRYNSTSAGGCIRDGSGL